MKGSISIIIPTLNEEKLLPATLFSLSNDTSVREIIVVDGGSTDTTVEIAAKAGAKLVNSPRGRGRQLNAGAALSSGEILLFLHADTLLPAHFGHCILKALSQPEIVGGAFSLGFDSDLKSLALVAWGANLRSRLLELPYGDQALFTSEKSFKKIGGFPEMDIMEDFSFVRSLGRTGKIITLRERVCTSSRRWQNIGVLRTSLINQIILSGYRIGVSPATLAKWYQRMRGVGKPSS